MEIIGYCTKVAMQNRYHNPNYAYKNLLNKIRNIPYEFGLLTKKERENYIIDCQSQIDKILLKPEKEWLNDCLSFELSSYNLNYQIVAK